MTDIEYTRQREWFNPNDHADAGVTIVGCGGIGSFTAIALAKLGIQRFDLIDFDTVEAHNFPNQFFSPDMIGEFKTDALATQLAAISGATITQHNNRLEESPLPLNSVVIAALDSMSARSELWNLVRMKLQCRLLLDGRLAGQRIVLYAVRPTNMTDIKGYEATLYSDEDAIEDSCTARSIIDVGFQVASLMTRAVRLTLANDREGVDPITYFNQETLEIMKGGWIEW